MSLMGDDPTIEEQLATVTRQRDALQRGCNNQWKRIAQLESALQLIGNELSLHADQGPAGDAFRALLNPTFRTG